jgi:hypothetical protein
VRGEPPVLNSRERLGQVFISYRREDSGGYARAIFDIMLDL